MLISFFLIKKKKFCRVFLNRTDGNRLRGERKVYLHKIPKKIHRLCTVSDAFVGRNSSFLRMVMHIVAMCDMDFPAIKSLTCCMVLEYILPPLLTTALFYCQFCVEATIARFERNKLLTRAPRRYLPALMISLSLRNKTQTLHLEFQHSK